VARAKKDTRYGYPPDVWAAAVDEIEAVLAAHARKGETITYGDLVAELRTVALRPHDYALPALLVEVDRRTFAACGFMLAAIVRHKGGDGMRGNRFFVTAAKLGRDVGDRRAFWEAEVARVFERYAPTRKRR
jgi:hypothetical protein